MADEPKLKPATSLPDNFTIHPISPRLPNLHPGHAQPALVPHADVPPLGPLLAFKGNWHGRGFNTIFRPNNTNTPTQLPNGPAQGDNVLELNLTEETLSFSSSLGAVPNRAALGTAQGDVFLNGVPYLQSINDITDPANPTGIHLEPGLWIIVPRTLAPGEMVTVARMASIPHGTTINAQGTFNKKPGPPVIPSVDITPIGNNGAGAKIRFPSQTATSNTTPRIPQDLATFIAAGTITQAILDDPNSVLRNAIAGQNIVETTTIKIVTRAVVPVIGGGTDNIAFLKPNADAIRMTAEFYIETIEHTLVIPTHVPNKPISIRPHASSAAHPSPVFELTPPHGIAAGMVIKVRSTQIQYTQTVFLNFNTLSWPHVSVATLVPAGPIVMPWP